MSTNRPTNNERNPRQAPLLEATTTRRTVRRPGIGLRPISSATNAALAREDEIDRRREAAAAAAEAAATRPRPQPESRSLLTTVLGAVVRGSPAYTAAVVASYPVRLLTGHAQVTGGELEPPPNSITTGRNGGVVETDARGRSTYLTREQFDNQVSAAHELQRRANADTRGETGRRATARRNNNEASRTTPATGDFPRPSETGQPTELEANSRSTVSTVGNSSTQFFNISSFRSEILENDVLPTHSYLVTFAPFRNGDGNDQYRENFPLTSFVRDKRNTLLLRCENVVLPTPALLEEENIRRYGYGPVEKVPYGVQFSDLSITWLVDKNSEIIDFMHQWLNTIVMHDSPNRFLQRGGASTRTGLDGYAPFEVGYKDAYTNPIVRVYVYNREQQTVTEYEMYDVFPMNIQSMNLSWADENQLQKLTVTFAYTNMKMSAPRKSTSPQTNFFEEERLNANEERQQPQDVGGRAAADSAAAPIDEFITRSFNSELPGASPAPINPIPAALAAPTLEVRDFTI